ncbi:MAG TPA: redoxin domain-containing protein [Candidatus Acidoferrales bacterium]|nr:redoxin domain-containing protein [Candidatus Acidoferrales bacterium]
MPRGFGAFLASFGAVVVAFLVLTLVHLQKQSNTAGGLGHESGTLRIERPEERIAAPDFVLQDPSGKAFRLKDLRGKVVLLNFWATWCPPCVQEMPTMEKLHLDLGEKGLVILAVNYQESPQQVRQFFAENRLTFTALLDPDGKVFGLYQAWGLPMSAIVNKRGELVGKVMGYRDWHTPEARDFFRALLAETG